MAICLICIRAQGETQIQTQEADGRALIFIITKGVGKGQSKQYQTIGSLEVRPGRGQKPDPSPKQYKGIGRLVVRTGRVVRQAGTES